MRDDDRMALSGAAPEPATAPRPPGRPDLGAYHDLARIIERMHRRFLDVVRVEIGRLGVDDISPVHALMLMMIGHDELSVRDLMERGYFLGSNASYNLKQLVDAGYVDRGASLRDRRAARLRLSEKGFRLHEALQRIERAQAEALAQDEAAAEDLAVTYRTLRRLERGWSDQIRYSARSFE
jgi:DNA-binding MarR family transcriptional regulator